MRWKAVALVAMLLVSGCISGDDSAGEPEELQTREANESTQQNAEPANASNNSTYLKNTDYNQTHVHDYWPGEATEKILMDDTVDTYPGNRDLEESGAAVGTAWFTLPNGSFVPVGTGKLIVEVDATAALENGEQALSYQARGQDEYTHMDAQGAEATWEIDVEPGMVDIPHARSTDWYFNLEADGHGSVMDGEVNVRITAEKTRSLEAWPEHPDFWDGGNKTRLDVGTTEADFDELDPVVGTIRIGDVYDSEEDETTVPLPEGELVPPETEVLYVQFWYQLDGDAKNEVNGDVEPLVQTGATSGWYESMEWSYQIDAREGYKEFAVPVGSERWDSPYAEQSAWSFRIDAPTGVRSVPVFEDMEMGLGEAGSGNVTFELTAYRELPPWLEEAMGEDAREPSTARALDAGAGDRLTRSH